MVPLIRGALILADVLVIVATWLKMSRHVKDVLDLEVDANTSTTMLADGACLSQILRLNDAQTVPLCLGTLYFMWVAVYSGLSLWYIGQLWGLAAFCYSSISLRSWWI